MSINQLELAKMIDHTFLKPDATEAQISKLCDEALKYQFCSVCVNPFWVPFAAQILTGSSVKVCTVIGFPLGATLSASKAYEATESIYLGAKEVDMVLNVGAMKTGKLDLVLTDIQAVVNAATGRALVKVILETGFLTEAEKIKACELCSQAGADFVKTSTGFGPGGATVDDIALMRRTVGPKIGVKASGGVRDYATTIAMIEAGANRIGTSSGIAIISNLSQNSPSTGGY